MPKNTHPIPYHLDIQNDRPLRLVQLTDCHLFADPESELQGINTRQSFDAICGLIRSIKPKPDLLLATGDLTQDASVEGYRYLAQALQQTDLPSFWIPGNHDDPQIMESILNGNCISPAKQIIAGQWQIILLDSTSPGETAGELGSQQFEFLGNCFNAFPDRPALVALHHQALPAGSEWIDAKGLRNQPELREILCRSEQVKAVLWGHVHQESERYQDGITWITPAASFSNDFRTISSCG